MGKIIMICYEKLEEIFNNLEEFEIKAKDNPNEIQQYLAKIQEKCNSKRTKTNPKCSGNEIRKAKDLSTMLITKYGLYGALEKISKIKRIFSEFSVKYLDIALEVVENEIEDILETSLRMKFPKLLDLSEKGQVGDIINLINSEENVKYLLGIDSCEEPIEQTTLYQIEETSNHNFRYDQYLRARRKLGAEDFLNKIVQNILGLKEFSKIAGDMLITITESQEICSKIHSLVPSKLMKIASLAVQKPDKESKSPTNQDQISIEEFQKVYSLFKK